MICALHFNKEAKINMLHLWTYIPNEIIGY